MQTPFARSWYTSFDSMKPFEVKHWEEGVKLSGLALQAIIPTVLH